MSLRKGSMGEVKVKGTQHLPLASDPGLNGGSGLPAIPQPLNLSSTYLLLRSTFRSRTRELPKLPFTPAPKSRPSKRAYEEEPTEPSKRQRQYGLRTPPEQSSDVSSNAQVPRFYTPRPPSSSSGNPAYPSPPCAHPFIPQKINPGYALPPNSFSNNQQYGFRSPLQPPTAPQMDYGNLYQVYGPYVNRHPAPAIQSDYVWGLHIPQTASMYGEHQTAVPTTVQQPAPTMQPEHARGLPLSQTVRSYESSHPMVPIMAANFPLQQQQQQRVASNQVHIPAHDTYPHYGGPRHAASLPPAIRVQGQYRYGTAPIAVIQAAPHLLGVKETQHSPRVPVGNVQTVQEKSRTQQEQWLMDALPDLQGKTVTIIPAIPAKQGTVGTVLGAQYDRLVPRDIWRLRSLSPSERYGAYSLMVALGRGMIQCGPASKEYQSLWKRIVIAREDLMKREVNFAARFKQDTAENRASWSQKVADQAAENPVDQKMVADYARYHENIASTIPLVDVAVKTQPPTSGQPLAEQKPATQQRPLPKSQTPRTPLPVVTQSAPEDPIKPDQRKHCLDKVPVPPYPLDKLEYFTPHEVTGMYKCNHSWDNGTNCCKVGLTRRKKNNSIWRTLATWRSKIEQLVRENKLHKSHITWEERQASKQRKDEKWKKMTNVEEKQTRNGKKADASAKVEARKERKKRWREEPHDATDAGAAPGPILAPDSLEQDVAPTSEVDSELSLEEEAATAETALQERIAKDVKIYEWELKRCKRLEGTKKWPNWPRFNEYWAAKRLKAQHLQLSAEQQTLLEGWEPSAIPDKNPAFVQKKGRGHGTGRRGREC
ncbi:hypothetical protein BKA58DRAFT_452459 [Alternaria rosae]|uniref:uncharacterized protein n=1 Tax=Alternaria rosae TaxID=1187941 RepID=UPI001E8CC9A1|nr:uncharacterized protein BKA58DRAFT_452459 [Alternaria rosae]KAH6878421.1 hypothetical protein BKA58DRAFT_452459 [Alternaria rosae]